MAQKPSPVTIERPDLFPPGLDPRVVTIERPTAPRAMRAVGDGPVLVLIKGTTHGEWAEPGSPFRRAVLEPAGLVIAARVDYWSEDVGGMPRWLNPWQKDPLSDWRIGGEFLFEMLRLLPFEARNVLGHSHALQPVSLAAAQLLLNNVTSISGPINSRMTSVYAAADKNISSFSQVRSSEFDRMQYLGSGALLPWRYPRDLPAAPNVRNIVLKGSGHSNALYSPEWWPRWQSDGLTPLLTGAA